jgi:hypothetical protein
MNTRYNEEKSPSAQVIYNDTGASVLGASDSASIVKDTCALAGEGGTLWTYKNQTRASFTACLGYLN